PKPLKHPNGVQSGLKESNVFASRVLVLAAKQSLVSLRLLRQAKAFLAMTYYSVGSKK
ncbi:MAG: hypothetical protein JNJ43_12160, partial [Anaerolineales bacterium]|nr:hypothetical protein [Anaerolineales bacterium]